MNRSTDNNNALLLERIEGTVGLHRLIGCFYDNMLEDYRINRFFNDAGVEEQKQTLEILLTKLLGDNQLDADIVGELLDNYFMSAFARQKRKSFVAGSDWSFFGEVIEQDEPNTELLSEAHFALLKLMPDDDNYDAMLENLQKTLQQEAVDGTLNEDVMNLAEHSRDAILGRKPSQV